MTTKKWRPLWSYDVEKTECWLSQLSAEGNRLTSVNRLTRIFTFDQDAPENVQYQVVYDKSNKAMSRLLVESNWEEALSNGKWRFLKNSANEIAVYPSREGIVKRNRIHFYVLAGLTMFYIMPLLMMFMLIWTLITDINSVEPSPFWWITALFFLQMLFVMGLGIFITKKLKTFEQKFFNGAEDVGEPSGKTFAKWRFMWVHAPDLLESWLSKMAAEGNHLVRIGKPGTRFIFEKGTPKRISYVFDYQLKTTPSYTDVHKSAGWQLKYTSPYFFTKYSLWAQEYVEGEEVPRFTNDSIEKKTQVRKVVLSSTGVFLFTVAIPVYYLWLSNSFRQEDGWNIFNTFIEWALIISLLSPLVIMIKTLKYALRMRRTY